MHTVSVRVEHVRPGDLVVNPYDGTECTVTVPPIVWDNAVMVDYRSGHVTGRFAVRPGALVEVMTSHREAVIRGLRAVAAWLEAHDHVQTITYAAGAGKTTGQARAEVERVARLAGSDGRPHAGRYGVRVEFGPVSYLAIGRADR